MKTIYYIFITCVCLLSSCSEEESSETPRKALKLTQNEVLSISYNEEAGELNDKTVLDLVSCFAKADNTTLTRNASTFKITKRTYINKGGEFNEKVVATRAADESVTSGFCEVEFQNGDNIGRAIVSSNANFPSVIAFIPNCSSDKVLEQTGASELLKASKASYLYKTIKMKELVDSLRKPTFEKISNVLAVPIERISYEAIKNDIEIVDAGTATRVTAIQGEDVEMQILPSTIMPYVKTNWGQDRPYNDWFANVGLNDWIRFPNGNQGYGPVPVGCVNIAMAQMMTFTHLDNYPIPFKIPGQNMMFIPNWDKMAQTPKLDDPGASDRGRLDAQYLLVDLYIENNTSPQKENNIVIGSFVAEADMLNTMNKYFKYDAKAAFNGDNAWASLRAKRLVLMLTKDHVFIISGILITEKRISTRELVKTNDVYWHANFGWADECTGFYQLDGNANTYFEANGTKEWAHKLDYINNIQYR